MEEDFTEEQESNPVASSDYDIAEDDFSSGQVNDSSLTDLRSIFIGEEERFLRNVRLRRGQYIRQNRRNIDSYIGRGTQYLTGASREAISRRQGRSNYLNNETEINRNMLSNSGDRDDTNIDKRSKQKLS